MNKIYLASILLVATITATEGNLLSYYLLGNRNQQATNPQDTSYGLDSFQNSQEMPSYHQNQPYPINPPANNIVHADPNTCLYDALARNSCGTPGIFPHECENLGCCWDSDYRTTLPRCFRRSTYAAQPAPVGFSRSTTIAPWLEQTNQQPYVPPQQPYMLPQQPYVQPQQPYVPPQQPFVPTQQPYIPPQTPYVPPKQTEMPTKKPYAATQQPVYNLPIKQQPSIQYSGCIFHCTSIPKFYRSVCNVPEGSCVSSGCCYDPSEADVTKRCFQSIGYEGNCPTFPECRLPNGTPEQCGGYGIAQSQCEAMGCCFHDIYHVPTCYKKQYVRNQFANFVAPSVIPKTPFYFNTPSSPTTTEKLDLLKMLQEMEARLKQRKQVSVAQIDYTVSPKSARPPTRQTVYTPPTPATQQYPVYQNTPPPTAPVLMKRVCYGNRCQYVPIPTPPPRMCFPQECGVPRHTPDKYPNFNPRKIVGGSRAYPFTHPWTVMIQKTEGNRTFICGGTLICHQWLITAAHCLDKQAPKKGQPTNIPDLNPNMYKIYVGRYTGWKVANHGRQVQVFKGIQGIERMFQHKDFKPGQHRGVITHDIALIKLRRPVRMNEYIQPACLPTAPAKQGEIMFATGWGVTKDKGPSASTLKQVGVEIRSQQVCRDEVPGFINPYGVICAGGEQSHDTCTGDSGGPLVGSVVESQRGFFSSRPKPKWYVYGLTSIGSPSCNTLRYDRQPAVYTDVFSYVDWIKKSTQNCCA